MRSQVKLLSLPSHINSSDPWCGNSVERLHLHAVQTGHHLLNSTQPPFHKAILESGSPTARFVLSPSHPRGIVHQAFFLQQSLCSSIEELKAMPLRPLLAAAGRVWDTFEPSVQWPFQPVVDGEGGMIPDTPVRLWEQRIADGRAMGMCVITGFCTHEGSSFVPASASCNDDFRTFFSTLIPSLTSDDLAALEALYPDPITNPSSPYANTTGSGGAQFIRLAAAYGDFAYIAPVLHTAHTLSSAGARVYVYEYAALSSPLRLAGHGTHSLAAAHDTEQLRRFPGMLDVAREMHGRMTSFVTEPSGDLGEAWPPFVSPEIPGGEGKLLVFGEGNDELAGGHQRGIGVRESVLTRERYERVKFWWKRMVLVQGMGATQELKGAS
ncbi:Alpha/Beta hydrolase protein [Mariannaea sp. PMI_226]|nr:Alpha/Beta hydrolase protein [Mariannaea sp. PMI_226]